MSLRTSLAMRLQTFLFDVGTGALSDARNRFGVRQNTASPRALAQDAFRDTEHIQHQLRWLANQLEDREVRAKRAVTEQFGLGENALGRTPTYGGIENDEATA